MHSKYNTIICRWMVNFLPGVYKNFNVKKSKQITKHEEHGKDVVWVNSPQPVNDQDCWIVIE